ncbi:hypothetical protein B0A75_01760 [Flavobacterium oncorhynchi]|uniref:Uncharacterized protein n=1 Tax=Flavobacterium oncorhynchi TaxID=728056 RepID=A0A226IAC6_9FLAO|nr:hypothetical protein [Flavobacterium oncorhynchi]OXB02969.1 hypothetical protein B0A75_01760 [Flavobacterium oncorhynchi]
MKTLNSIAIEYLLRNDSQNNNSISEELTKEVVRINTEQNIKNQKSLLFQMYDLEDEDLFI